MSAPYAEPFTQMGAGWMYWPGGECPVDRNALVQVRCQWPDEDTYRTLPLRRAWAHNWDAVDMIAYKVVE